MLERLNALPVSSFHYKLLVVAGIGWVFDSMDTGLIAFVLPLLIKEWGLSATQAGMLGSIGLVGMALGAVAAGTLADRVGRKTVFSVTIVLYSLATGLCAVAPNYELLVLFRFLVGLGLGGELPVAATLVTEYVPGRARGRFMVLLESFWAVGWLLAALIAYFIIPVTGWRTAFLIGALPALYTMVIRMHLPESVRYLLKKGKIEEARKIVSSLEERCHMEPRPLEVTGKDVAEETKGSFTSLWTSRFIKRTVMLWLVWFGIVFSYYGVFMWLPSLVFKQGFTVVKTFEYVLVMTLSQLPGYAAAAWLVDRLGRRYTLSLFLLGSGIASYFFGHAETVTALLCWGATMSFFNLGAWGVIYTYTPELYPTAIRGLGCGWATGFGRVGGMVAPLLVGALLTDAWDMGHIFYIFAGVFVLISFIVLTLGTETKRKELESLS